MISLEDLWANIVEYLPDIIWAAIIVLFALYFARLLRKMLTSTLTRAGAEPGVTVLLSQMAYWGVASLGLILALGRFVDLTAVVASLGLVGFALTFALQDVLKNFVAGIMLLVQRPFTVGDYVEVCGYEGNVTAVHSRSTEVRTGDGLTVLLPNASVLDNPIVNYSRTPERRVDVLFNLPYDCDLPLVRQLSLKAVEGVAAYLEAPAPDVLFDDASGGITLRARLWVDALEIPASVSKDQALSLIYEALRVEGIEMRYPRQEVVLYSKTE
jgi:small conductance mechanosensitive channel